eukprot:PhF_6_TR2311/c1_g1_i6/m.4081
MPELQLVESEQTPTFKIALVFLFILGSAYMVSHVSEYSPRNNIASSSFQSNETSSPTTAGLPKLANTNKPLDADDDTKNRKSSSCGDTLIVGPGEWKNTTITTSSSSSLLFHELNCPGNALTDYNNYEQKTKLRECLRGKKLLFIGHSHMRYVVIELGHMLGIYVYVDKRRTTVLRDREYDITIHYGFSW